MAKQGPAVSNLTLGRYVQLKRPKATPAGRDLSAAVIRQEFTHRADNFFQMRFQCEVAGW
jgi:hypothetical protein